MSPFFANLKWAIPCNLAPFPLEINLKILNCVDNSPYQAIGSDPRIGRKKIILSPVTWENGKQLSFQALESLRITFPAVFAI